MIIIEDANGNQWYAKHKILAVKSKLHGAHPCKIVEDDLMLSIHKNLQYMIKLKQLLWGNEMGSKRMDLLSKEQLTAREQVFYFLPERNYQIVDNFITHMLCFCNHKTMNLQNSMPKTFVCVCVRAYMHELF